MKETKIISQDFFPTPIWKAEFPQFVEELNKHTDSYIKKAEKFLKDKVKEREKIYGKVGDYGLSKHSTALYDDPNFSKFKDFIGTVCYDFLTQCGFDLSKYNLHFTEMWVQEFSKRGGGHHSIHTHWNQHVSGFYFLKCNKKTSYPVFHDPRSGAQMTKLPQINGKEVTRANESIAYSTTPGTLIIFPGYVPHEFVSVPGTEPFRFIHFNIQALPTVYCK
jgi:uncharacterized protein (TIGR02466 family)